MTMVRLVEHAGLGALAGALIGLLVVAVCICLGRPALELSVSLPAAGAACGLMWGLLRRPTRLAALMIADRHFALKDLLSTAWLLPREPDCPLMRAVLAQARQRAAALAPGEVALRRLGARFWSAVGLATALVLVMGLFSVEPAESDPSAAAGRTVARVNATRPEQLILPTGVGWSVRPDAPAMGPDYRGTGDEPLDPAARLVADPKRSPTPGDGQSVDGADPHGAGGGAARSDPTRPADPLTVGATAAGRQDSRGGDPSGGVGSAVSGTSARGGSTGVAGGQTPSPPAAPWSAASWKEAQTAAENALSKGEIPADCRDIVRAYFSP